MSNRLARALITSAVAAAVGVGVALWQKPDFCLQIALIASLIGFFFGLVFKFRLS
jgi:hypothetical protein